jgi:hypothetical protein
VGTALLEVTDTVKLFGAARDAVPVTIIGFSYARARQRNLRDTELEAA